jgi:hypothetical protein
MSVFNAESEHPPPDVGQQWSNFSTRGSNVFTEQGLGDNARTDCASQGAQSALAP